MNAKGFESFLNQTLDKLGGQRATREGWVVTGGLSLVQD